MSMRFRNQIYHLKNLATCFDWAKLHGLQMLNKLFACVSKFMPHKTIIDEGYVSHAYFGGILSSCAPIAFMRIFTDFRKNNYTKDQLFNTVFMTNLSFKLYFYKIINYGTKITKRNSYVNRQGNVHARKWGRKRRFSCIIRK